MRRIKLSISLLLWAIMLFSFAGVSLAASFPEKTNVDPQHNWTVKFNAEVNPSTITPQTVYVTRGTEKIATNVFVNADQTSITVKAPTNGYLYEEQYMLHISDDVYAASTQKMKEPVTMSFVIKSKPAATTLYQAIYNALNNMETEVNVAQFTTNSDVAFAELNNVLDKNLQFYYLDAEKTEFWTDGRFVFNYKYTKEQVEAMNNDSATLYSSIYTALKNIEPQVELGRFTRNSKEAFAVLNQVLDDHPDIYYFEHQGSSFYSDGLLELNYIASKQQITATNSQITQVANKIIAENITAGMTDFEKVKAIHDYIVLHTAYDYDNYLKNTIPDSSYRIDGLLLQGIAVCDGYAKTMKYILEQIGIETLYVTGKGNGELHAWNKVKIDGVWYSLDATFNDPSPNVEGYISYQYFLIPDNQLAKDHIWDDVSFPDATSTKYVFMSDMNDPELHNGYYYYSSNSEDITLYKIAIDGTGKQQLNSVRAEELELFNDWIYFNNYSNSGYLYRIKTDGSQLEKLNSFHVQNLEIKQNVLYYTNENGTENYQLILQ